MIGQKSQEDAAVLAVIKEKDQIQADLDSCQLDRDRAVRQLQVYIELNDALNEKISNLETELRKQHGALRQEIQDLSQELADFRNPQGIFNPPRIDPDSLSWHNSEERKSELYERELLLERIGNLEQEAQKWKDEAFGRGSKAVSICWQGSVDEAVRRERKKDGWIVKNLQDEIQRSRAEQLAEATRHVAECEEATQGNGKPTDQESTG